MCLTILICAKPIISKPHIHSFSAHYTAENSTKSISTINPAIMENKECLIVKAHTSFINLKVDVSLDHVVSLHFVSLLALPTCWATFQTKNNGRSALLTLHLPQSCTEAIIRVLQIDIYAAVEKGMEYKGEQRQALVKP